MFVILVTTTTVASAVENSDSVVSRETEGVPVQVIDDVSRGTIGEGSEDSVISDESGSMELLPETSPWAAINGDYSVGTSHIAIFSGVVSGLPLGVNYVYWREGRYDYCLAYGPDLALSGTTFSGSDVSVVTYDTYAPDGQQPSFTSRVEPNFTLNAHSWLVWSNLGSYPRLERRYERYEGITCLMLCIAALFSILCSWCRRINI